MLSIFIVSIPAEELQASRLWDFFYKRYLKRSKMKKWAPKLLGGEVDLNDLEINDKYEVIGFEPSWLLDEKGTFEEQNTYYFNLMTTLVSGEYDINPEDGMPRNPESLYAPINKIKTDKEIGNVSIYQKAYAVNTRIKLLTALTYSGDFGTPAYRTRYENDVISKDEIFENLDDQLEQYYQTAYSKIGIKPGRIGVLVDFDFSSPSSDKEYFLSFLQNLRERFPDNLLYLKIPPLIRANSAYPTEFIQDLLSLEEGIVDMFVMEAYGFEKSYKRNINSVHLDKDAKYSVESSVEHYSNFEFEEYDEDRIQDMQEKFRELLVLELPFYGAIWQRKDRVSDYKLKKQNQYMSFDNFWQTYIGKSGKFKYSEDSTYLYSENDKNEIAYGQDSLTFYTMTHYIVDSLGLKGFGMNSLGYYFNKPQALGKKLKRIWYGYANIDSNITKKRESLGWVIAYFIVAFIPIGFVYSIGYYWQVRNALAKHKKYYKRVRGLFLLFLFIFLVVADIIPRNEAGLVIGFILLAFLLIYILIKKVLIRSKKYVNALR